MSSFGLIEENMELSRIHLAVRLNNFLALKVKKKGFLQFNSTYRSVTKPVLGNTKGRRLALKFGSIVARFE